MSIEQIGLPCDVQTLLQLTRSKNALIFNSLSPPPSHIVGKIKNDSWALRASVVDQNQIVSLFQLIEAMKQGKKMMMMKMNERSTTVSSL